MDAFSTQVRQLAQFTLVNSLAGGELALIQRGGLGGPYASIAAADLVGWGLASGGDLKLSVGGRIVWNGTLAQPATLAYGPAGGFVFSQGVNVGGNLDATGVSVAGQPVATFGFVQQSLDYLAANTVASFNGRTGAVELCTADITRSGGAPADNPVFTGLVVGPTNWNPALNDSTLVTSAWVQSVLALAPWLNSPAFTGQPTVPTPPAGDYSQTIANTRWTSDELLDLKAVLEGEMAGAIAGINLAPYAPINSPQFTGIPTAPTAAQTVNSGQLATTAFVHAAVVASTTGVASFNTRTGAVTLALADIAGAGGAALNSPVFTGVPAGPTAAPGTATTQLATTAFVAAAVTAGITVSSFNTRTGAVVLTAADVTAVGGALLASPALSGTPTAPTAVATTNSTQLATTAFVANAITNLPAPVTSFNGRTGVITLQASDVSAAGGALTVSPAFTGAPTAPTQAPGTNNTDIATTAFVAAALTAAGGVTAFNGRAGAVTLTAADVTGAGGAPIASPTFTGTPAAPTAAVGTNSAQLATTAFVTAALAASSAVSSFNGRTGAVTFQASDVSAVGGALLASPSFTGSPLAPTQSPGVSNTTIATTAFVMQAIGAAGGVTSFNGRAGVVTLQLADVTGAGGAPIASPTFTGTPAVPTAAAGTNTTQAASTAFVANAVSGIILPRSYIAALTLFTAGSSTTFTVAAGMAANSTNAAMLTLAAAISKTTASWVVGTSNGGLDTGAIAANTWYHVHLIMRTDTQVVDALVSLSPTAPTLPANYTLFRRIGAMRTNASSQWTGFVQVGDEFIWTTSVLDVSAATPGTASRTLYALSVPTGVQVNAMFRGQLWATGSQSLIFTSPDESDQAISNGIGDLIGPNSTGSQYAYCSFNRRTNTLAQIGVRLSSAGPTVYIGTYGWIDNRGRNL